MPRSYLAILSVAVLAACGDSGQLLAPPADATRTMVTNERVPYSQVVFVSCANGGAGEDVLLQGTIHEITRSTESAGGTFSIAFHANFQGISGTGLTTGDSYQGTGAFNFRLMLGPGERGTLTEHFSVIGPGPENNFIARTTVHFTVNANGDVTSEVDNTSATCS